MTDKIEDGGPAFPQLDVTSCERDGHGDLIDPFTSSCGGMSLRDKFAEAALIGFGTWSPNIGDYPTPLDTISLNARADLAYRQADAMLRARKGTSDE